MAQHFSTANNSHFGYGDKLDTSVTLINIVCSLDVAHCYAIDCEYLDSLVQRFKLLLFFSLFMGYLWLISFKMFLPRQLSGFIFMNMQRRILFWILYIRRLSK